MYTLYALPEFTAAEWMKATCVETLKEGYNIAEKLRSNLVIKIKVTMLIPGDGPDALENFGKEGPIHNFSNKAKIIWNMRQKEDAS